MRLKMVKCEHCCSDITQCESEAHAEIFLRTTDFLLMDQLLEGPIPPLVLLRHHSEGVLSATWSQYANGFSTIPVASLLGIFPPKKLPFLFAHRKRSRDVNSVTGNVILLQLSPVLLCMCIWNTHDCDCIRGLLLLLPAWLYSQAKSSSGRTHVAFLGAHITM